MITKIRRAGALFAALLLIPGCPGLGDMMRAYGYVELANPSTLLAPGAMIYIVSRNPLKTKLICGPRASLGPNWQPLTSLTVTRSITKHSGKTFKLGVNFMDQIKGDARFSAIKDVTATLSDASIVELDDVSVLSNLRYRSPECQLAVDSRNAAGYKISMVSSALQGDITYSVKWSQDSNIDASVKIAQLENLAIELGAGNSCISENTIKASNLTYGVRDDEYLASITITEVDEKTIKRGSRLLPVEETTDIDLSPDAPIVQPPGGQECIGTSCKDGSMHDIGIVPIKPKINKRTSSIWD